MIVSVTTVDAVQDEKTVAVVVDMTVAVHCETVVVMAAGSTVTVVVGAGHCPLSTAFTPPLPAPSTVAAVVAATGAAWDFAEVVIALATVAVAVNLAGALAVTLAVVATPRHVFSWAWQSETAKVAPALPAAAEHLVNWWLQAR